MKLSIKKLENEINVVFENKNLLSQSMTHKSFDEENNNEKLEFLGDRVIGLVISKRLLVLYPHESEGIIDKKFSNLVNKKICKEIAARLNLKKYQHSLLQDRRKILSHILLRERRHLRLKLLLIKKLLRY